SQMRKAFPVLPRACMYSRILAAASGETEMTAFGPGRSWEPAGSFLAPLGASAEPSKAIDRLQPVFLVDAAVLRCQAEPLQVDVVVALVKEDGAHRRLLPARRAPLDADEPRLQAVAGGDGAVLRGLHIGQHVLPLALEHLPRPVQGRAAAAEAHHSDDGAARSEERRVGKDGRSRGAREHSTVEVA